MKLPGTTPGAPDDDGAADPRLTAALASRDVGAVAAALLTARLLVPVVALPGAGDAEMAVPALVAADGSRALPVFSSYDALRAWQPDARPVPMAGARVFLAAAAEGYEGVVLDVAGPVSHTVAGAHLATLGAAAQALGSNPSATIQIVGPDSPRT
jgi:type III secretion system (T3SS) SseB-like protein